MDFLGVIGFILSIIVGLLILVILVAMHEFGHGVVARRNGVRVEEFGIGFPPKAKGWNVKKSVLGKNVLYSLNWLPLGGFVKLQGEHDSAKKKGDYGAASFWTKTKILLAGVFVNWVTAAVLFSIVALFGIPSIINGQFMMPGDTVVDRQPVVASAVSEGLPAAEAGLQKGDDIVSIDGQQLYAASQLVEATKNLHGKTVAIEYVRDGVESTTDVTLRNENGDGKGYLGLGLSQEKPTTFRSTWSAPIVGVALTGQFTWYTLQSLGDVFVKFVTGLVDQVSFNSSTREAGSAKLGEAGSSVGGPVALIGTIFPAALAGGGISLMLVTAFIALTLAVMNALPIPALDGGRWFVTFWYHKVLKKPLSKEKEEKIHGTGFMILMGLFVLVTIADVMKLW